MGLQEGRCDEVATTTSTLSCLSLREFLERCGGYAVLDGGLATELERHGQDLDDPLWSAKSLIHSPHLIRRVHLDYLDAGADIIISASYQATIQGFKANGLSGEESEALLRRSVEIACEARQIYNSRLTKTASDQFEGGRFSERPILVAASVGSYGAYLADGSEYSGKYGDAVTVESLKNFHRRRVQVLAESGADIIAFETIPRKLEAQAYVELLEEEGIDIPAWLSFSCKDESKLVSGDSILDCVSIANSSKHVEAVGVNCTAPRHINGLISAICKVSNKPVVVYPNSGETYDGESKQWLNSDGEEDGDFVGYVSKWRKAGASLIGGCCRTTPKTIRGISNALSNSEGCV